MIKQYIDGIQALLIRILPHYKENIRTNPTLDEKEIQELENTAKASLSSDLRTFLAWSGIMPVWNAPFIPFVKNAHDVAVWVNRLNIIQIRLKRERFGGHFEIMHGSYTDADSSPYIFRVCVDIHGSHTERKDAVYVIYGKKRPSYPDQFAEGAPINTQILAATIEDFAKKYLAYLKTIPAKPTKFPALDSLLSSKNYAKLFAYVKNYNWDDGQDKMEYIARDHRCDLATALFVYWLSEPYQFDEKAGKDLDMLPFIIEEKVKKDAYAKSGNTFDPRKNDSADFIDEYENAQEKMRKIPDFMLQKSA